VSTTETDVFLAQIRARDRLAWLYAPRNPLDYPPRFEPWRWKPPRAEDPCPCPLCYVDLACFGHARDCLFGSRDGVCIVADVSQGPSEGSCGFGAVGDGLSMPVCFFDNRADAEAFAELSLWSVTGTMWAFRATIRPSHRFERVTFETIGAYADPCGDLDWFERMTAWVLSVSLVDQPNRRAAFLRAEDAQRWIDHCALLDKEISVEVHAEGS
jgi:hypothetical protein